MPTVAELKAICKKKGITGYSTLRKAELEKKCMYTKLASTPKKSITKSTPRRNVVPKKRASIKNKKIVVPVRWSKSKIDHASTKQLIARKKILDKWMSNHQELNKQNDNRYHKVYDEYDYINEVLSH